MSIPGPSSSHRRGTNARTRENQLPRTFLRARGGLGDAPTTSATEDDVQPRRERKKRNRSTLNNTSTPTPGPGGNSEMDVGKPLPRPPSKLNRIVTPRAEAASQALGTKMEFESISEDEARKILASDQGAEVDEGSPIHPAVRGRGI